MVEALSQAPAMLLAQPAAVAGRLLPALAGLLRDGSSGDVRFLALKARGGVRLCSQGRRSKGGRGKRWGAAARPA